MKKIPTLNSALGRPDLENSVTYSKSGLHSVLNIEGQPEDVQEILQEEDNIKEASQFRQRDLLLRHGSGINSGMYRQMATIQDPEDQIEDEHDPEYQIERVKRFCRQLCCCSCRRKTEEFIDPYSYTSGESDIECAET